MSIALRAPASLVAPHRSVVGGLESDERGAELCNRATSSGVSTAGILRGAGRDIAETGASPEN